MTPPADSLLAQVACNAQDLCHTLLSQKQPSRVPLRGPLLYRSAILNAPYLLKKLGTQVLKEQALLSMAADHGRPR